MLHWSILVVMAEAVNKIFTNWHFTEIVYQPLVYWYQLKLFLGNESHQKYIQDLQKRKALCAHSVNYLMNNMNSETCHSWLPVAFTVLTQVSLYELLLVVFHESEQRPYPFPSLS